MHNLEIDPPEKKGSWLYAGSTSCEVRIVRHHTLYGTGDYEDPPDIAEDRSVECFYVIYSTPAGQPKWVGGGAALSLSGAVALAEEKLGPSLVWGT